MAFMSLIMPLPMTKYQMFPLLLVAIASSAPQQNPAPPTASRPSSRASSSSRRRLFRRRTRRRSRRRRRGSSRHGLAGRTSATPTSPSGCRGMTARDGRRQSRSPPACNPTAPVTRAGTRSCFSQPVVRCCCSTRLVRVRRSGGDWCAPRRINGRSWSEAIALPPGILGPIRAKPVEISSRRTAVRIEHRRRRLDRPHGALRWSMDCCGAGIAGIVAEDRSAEYEGGVRRDSADDPRALADRAADSQSKPAIGHHGVVVEGRRTDVEQDDGDDAAESQRGRRRSTARHRTLAADLQPDDKRSGKARRGDLRGRTQVDVGGRRSRIHRANTRIRH